MKKITLIINVDKNKKIVNNFYFIEYTLCIKGEWRKHENTTEMCNKAKRI